MTIQENPFDCRKSFLPSTEADHVLPHSIPLSTQSQESKSQNFGYFLMAISCIGYSVMSLQVRIAITLYNIQITECVLIGAVILVLFSSLYILYALNFPQICLSLTFRQWILLAFRGTMGALGVAFFFAGLKRLPVAHAITIFSVCPIITMCISTFVFAEPITLIDVIATVISFVGIVFIAQPTMDAQFLFSDNRLIGIFFTVASAFVSACAYVTVGYLGSSVHFMLSNVSIGFATLLLALEMDVAMGPVQLFKNKEGTLLVILASIFGFGGQCAVNLGLQHCSAGPGVLVRNLDVPIAYVLGWAFLGENPTWLGSIGSTMVLFGTSLIGLRKSTH